MSNLPKTPIKRFTAQEHMLLIARVVSLRSSCVRRTVGCVLTDERFHILGTGYNGTAHGDANCTDSPCAGALEIHGKTELCEAIHAEENAILHCIDRTRVVHMFCTDSPCIKCARRVSVLTGLKFVHYVRLYTKEGVNYLEDKLKITIKGNAGEYQNLFENSKDLWLGERPR